MMGGEIASTLLYVCLWQVARREDGLQSEWLNGCKSMYLCALKSEQVSGQLM